MAIGSGLAAQIGMAEEVYTNEQQTLTNAASSGNWTITFEGATTATIASTTASAANVQSALNALPNVGSSGVSCSGGPLGTSPITVTFQGALVKNRNVGQMTVSTSPNPVVATTVPGTGYGDAQTVTRFLEFVNEAVKLGVERIESSALRTGSNVLRTDRWAANRKGAAGDVTWEVSNTGFGLLFKHMFGTSVISTPTNGVLTRDHTYTFSDLYQARSMTVQLGVPDVNGTVNAFTYKGAKIASWEISNQLDQIVMLKTMLDAQDEDQTISLAAASYPASQVPFTFVGGTITNTQLGSWAVRDISVTCDRGLARDRYFVRSNTLKKEPINNALMGLGVQVAAEMESTAAYNLYANGTDSQITATWVGAQIEAVSPTYFYTLTLTIPHVRFDGESPDVAGPDIVVQPMTGKILYDGSASPITLLYRTTDTTD